MSDRDRRFLEEDAGELTYFVKAELEQTVERVLERLSHAQQRGFIAVSIDLHDVIVLLGQAGVAVIPR